MFIAEIHNASFELFIGPGYLCLKHSIECFMDLHRKGLSTLVSETGYFVSGNRIFCCPFRRLHCILFRKRVWTILNTFMCQRRCEPIIIACQFHSMHCNSIFTWKAENNVDECFGYKLLLNGMRHSSPNTDIRLKHAWSFSSQFPSQSDRTEIFIRVPDKMSAKR